ncbi:type IX secretion system sortase PorU [Dysgonomonas sp. 520]|uniref:type IX secretion system sortase PorU n=1 Tax=Dysgonomonas sp. 520 TaxID=2302931 RepID=UPI0013D6F0CA|nr:type IX secretion system sortase PorU [Dysgonomonas sp. 520]NDW09889.1 hypothetical protein [Dysgonomonas sp. 520]
MKRTFFYTILSTLVFLFTNAGLLAQTSAAERYAQNSVLSEGNWYKIKIESDGVYKLTYDDLKKMGLSNPANVQIHGYGGQVLDEDFRNGYVDDLPKVSIWMSNSPANFGVGDYILFYGKGDIKWTYDGNGEFTHAQHPYSSESFYFVTENSSGSNIVESVESLPMGSNIVTTFRDYALHEKELVNVDKSGRCFLGENFKSLPTQTFNFTLKNVTADPATITYRFTAKAQVNNAKLNVSVNGGTTKSDVVRVAESDLVARIVNSSISQSALTENTSVKVNYEQGSASDANVYLDYIRINYTRSLKPTGAVTLFRSTVSDSNLGYKISNATTNMLVLDVTDNFVVKKVNATLSESELSFAASNTSIREYALVDLSATDIPKPSMVGKINNQDLHSLPQADMVIISQPLLYEQAKRLASLHEDELSVIVISPEDIFNEFSSGKPDFSAYRRFVKMFYDRAQSEEEKPKYVLLFGDGSYDNKFITNHWESNDKRGMLLTYQTDNTNKSSLTGAYTTDDYIGFLDDSAETSLGSNKLNVGVGRLPVRTVSEAKSVVDKIERYMDNKEKGIWQNTITFVADDAVAKYSYSTERQHIEFSDNYAETLKKEHPWLVINKIYEDAFERVQTSSGFRYPDAQKAMHDKLEQGTLVLNYVGHGSERDWAHEQFLTYSMVEDMTNSKYPLWITATCDYSRFDSNSTSGGKTALLNTKGGAIALFSTVREVEISKNNTMNTAIVKHLFDFENGKPLRLGDIMQRAKCESTLSKDENKLKFLLLGDPALRLNVPDNIYQVKVTDINGLDASTEDIKIAALSDNRIKGQIVDMEGNIVPDFNGTLESVVFDNEQKLKTRGHAKEGGVVEENIIPYNDFSNIIYMGTSQVTNGEFEINFVAPMDILYTEGYGKMNFYAHDETNAASAKGYFNQYTVNGTNEDLTRENVSPVIEKLYLNDESFKSGGKVNPTPLFYAKVSDNTGINLSNGIGHNISLLLNDKTEYNLSSYFVNQGASAREGYVQYQLPELSEGKHKLQFKVWDVWNNSSTEVIDFIVDNNYKPSIYSFTLGGNPAKEKVRFIFTSNIPGSNVKVKYKVYSLNGAEMWSYEENAVSNSTYYDWDLTTSGGMRMKPGIYICRIFVSVDGGAESSKAAKLIVSDMY